MEDTRFTQHAGPAKSINHKCVQGISKGADGNPTALDEQLLNSVEAEVFVQQRSIVWYYKLDQRRRERDMPNSLLMTNVAVP